MAWHDIVQHARKKFFEITTIVLAVVAIVFACIQYGDSRKQLNQSAGQLEGSKKQLEKLEQITSAIQTSYVGEFPRNMDRIMDVVKQVSERSELDIMTDFAGYAIYSRYDAYQAYSAALVRDRQKDVTVKMLVYDEKLAETALRTQFKEKDFVEEQGKNFRGFFASHPPVPANYDEFVARLLELQEHAIVEMCDNGIDIRRVPPSQKYLFFLWANNGPEAVFAFRNETAKNRELSFFTVDRSLTEVFTTVFNNTWDSADPSTHSGLQSACRPIKKPN